MSLQGSLENLGLADLLQTGLAGRTGGYLVLRRHAQHAMIYVAESGLHLLEPDPLDPQDVLRAFARSGVLTEIQALGEPAGEDPTARIDRLTAEGTLPESTLVEVLVGVAEDAILDLLTWQDGTFRFNEKPLESEHVGLVGRIGVDLSGVMLRAAQRMDERESISRSLGLHPALFRSLPSETPFPELDTVATSDVYLMLDGECTVAEVALTLGIGRFDVLKAVQALAVSGHVRAATGEELAQAVERLGGAARWRSARDVCLQWNELEPLNPAPLRRLTDVLQARGAFTEFLGVLVALGYLHIQRGEPQEALSVFRHGLERAPKDEDLLAGLRQAAEACGDTRSYTAATMSLATAAFNEGDAERTARLTRAVCTANAEELTAHVLCARALVKLGDTDGLVDVAAAAADVLGPRARRREDREAASFFRDAIARVAPERTDLLRRFRSLSESGRSVRPSKKTALLVALLVVLSGAGVVFWPTSASSLYDEAQAAIQAGDREHALEIIDKLIEDFPDSAEAENAFQLQATLLYPDGEQPGITSAHPGGTPTTTPTTTPVVPVQTPAMIFAAALADLPSSEARAKILPLVEELERPQATSDRRTMFRKLGSALPATVRTLERHVRERNDTLGQAYGAVERFGDDAKALGKFMDLVYAARDDTDAEELKATFELLKRVGHLQDFDLFNAALDDFEITLQRFAEHRESSIEAILLCERALATRRLEEAHERCTREAPGLFVNGRITQADAIYAALEDLLGVVAADPDLAPVVDAMARRGLDEFVRVRRDTIAEIQRELDAAAAAEDAGDLNAAATVYAGLVRKHWQVRFENVFTLPLDVTSTPFGAQVLVNGKPAGTTPCRVRYPWGAQTTLAIRVDGYEQEARVLQTIDGTPTTSIKVHLRPVTTWSVEVGPTVEARPLSVGDDVLVLDRSGRVVMYNGTNGDVLWARHYRSLEGIRTRPVLSSGYLTVAFVDGQILFLDPRDGTKRGEVQVGRTTGELATTGEIAAVLTSKDEIVSLRGSRISRRTALPSTPTAGALAAHGAFWVGTAEGAILRIDPVSLRVERLPLAETSAIVMGLAATHDGLLATTADGRVYALDARGQERWRKGGLGDLTGTAAQTGGIVAVSDRRGRLLFFDAATGAPAGAEDLDAEPRGGVLALGGRFMTALRDGRVWIYDVSLETVIVDAQFGGRARFLPAVLTRGRIAVNTRGYRLAVLPIPR